MSSKVRLRRAKSTDAQRLRDWRNEAETRAASFNASAITCEEHARWFDRKLADPRACVLIAVDAAGEDVGYVRLYADGESAEISVSIDRKQRDRGIGREVIRAAAVLALRELGVCRVVARVKADNARARAAFAGAGFIPGSAACDGVVELVFGRDQSAIPPEGDGRRRQRI